MASDNQAKYPEICGGAATNLNEDVLHRIWDELKSSPNTPPPGLIVTQHYASREPMGLGLGPLQFREQGQDIEVVCDPHKSVVIRDNPFFGDRVSYDVIKK